MDVKHEIENGLQHLKLRLVLLGRIVASNNFTDSSESLNFDHSNNLQIWNIIWIIRGTPQRFVELVKLECWENIDEESTSEDVFLGDESVAVDLITGLDVDVTCVEP